MKTFGSYWLQNLFCLQLPIRAKNSFQKVAPSPKFSSAAKFLWPSAIIKQSSTSLTLCQLSRYINLMFFPSVNSLTFNKKKKLSDYKKYKENIKNICLHIAFVVYYIEFAGLYQCKCSILYYICSVLCNKCSFTRIPYTVY